MLRIAREIDRGCLGSRHLYRPAWCIEALNRNSSQSFASDEPDSHRSQVDRPFILLHHCLEYLGPVVRRAMVLRRGQQSGIVRNLAPFHQRGQKLVCRKAAKAPVLGWDDDIKASGRTRYKSVFRKPVEAEPRGVVRYA